MGNLGFSELLIIFLVVLLVFGAKRIPEIARGLGKGIREFKDATNDLKREINIDDTPGYRVQPPYQGSTTARTDPYYQPEPTPVQPDPAAQPTQAPGTTETPKD